MGVNETGFTLYIEDRAGVESHRFASICETHRRALDLIGETDFWKIETADGDVLASSYHGGRIFEPVQFGVFDS